MKRYYILLLSLSYVGCTSMQPATTSDKDFFAQKIGSVNNYNTTVQTKSGRIYSFTDGQAEYDTTNGILLLKPKYSASDSAKYRALGDTEKLQTFRASDICNIYLDSKIRITTIQDVQYEAEAGNWWFELLDDSSYLWKGKYADVGDNASVIETSVRSNDIKKLELTKFDNVKTGLLIFSGIILSIEIKYDFKANN